MTSALRAAALTMLVALATFALGATPEPTEALGRWLPDVAPNFVAWGQAKARFGGRFDSLRCGKGTLPTKAVRDFTYSIGTCRLLQSGTTLFYGSGEPQQGHVVYDAVHRVALYDVGCCAARTYVLAGNVGAPPVAVRSADLSAARTARGATLGMTPSQIENLYGKAKPYDVRNGGTAVRVTSYTTFSSDPVHSSQGCGQYQSFAFKNGKVSVIQIYVGC